MGYSVSTPVRRTDFDRMMAFLEREFRQWGEVAKGRLRLTGTPVTLACNRGDGYEELAYDHGKWRIGFNYHGGVEWAFAVCVWLAFRVGRRVRVPWWPDPLPYIVYDGKKRWFVLPPGADRSVVPAGVMAYSIDEHGWRPHPSIRDHYDDDGWQQFLAGDGRFLALVLVDEATAEELGKAEVARLDQAWLAQSAKPKH